MAARGDDDRYGAGAGAGAGAGDASFADSDDRASAILREGEAAIEDAAGARAAGGAHGGAGGLANPLVADLLRALRNEKAAPDLLPFQTDLVATFTSMLVEQRRGLDETPKSALARFDTVAALYEADVARLRYLLAVYLRTRLAKVREAGAGGARRGGGVRVGSAAARNLAAHSGSRCPVAAPAPRTARADPPVGVPHRHQRRRPRAAVAAGGGVPRPPAGGGDGSRFRHGPGPAAGGVDGTGGGARHLRRPQPRGARVRADARGADGDGCVLPGGNGGRGRAWRAGEGGPRALRSTQARSLHPCPPPADEATGEATDLRPGASAVLYRLVAPFVLQGKADLF
jgi:hypothetical protein